MQAEGFGPIATEFNNVQRGHQQALESYTSLVAMSLLGGIGFPISVTLGGVYWCYARLKWAEGYRVAAKDRYNHWSAVGVWVGLVTAMFASGAVAVKMLIN